MDITEPLYAAILATWCERPTLKNVCETLEIPRATVKQVRDNGVPELGLDPLPSAKLVNQTNNKRRTNGKNNNQKAKPEDHKDFDALCYMSFEEVKQHSEAAKDKLVKLSMHASEVGQQADVAEAEQEIDGTLAELDNAETRLAEERSRIADVSQRAITADKLRRAAQEDAAARMQLDMCVNLGAIHSFMVDQLAVALTSGGMALPDTLDPKWLSSLVNTLERLTMATERAIKVSKGRAGEQGEGKINVLVGQVVNLLDGCSEEEMRVIASTGALPKRVRLAAGNNEDDE
jgi:hypothetical protein